MNAAVHYKVFDTKLEISYYRRIKSIVIYDFEKVGFSKVVAKAFIRAFVAQQGANTIESQRACWIHVKSFGKFSEENFKRPDRLPRDCLSKFSEWLQKMGFGVRTVGSRHNTAVRMLSWCERNAPEAVAENIELIRSPYASRFIQRDEKISNLGEQDIKKILSACYSEIEVIQSRLSSCSFDLITEGDGELSKLLFLCFERGGGELPVGLQKTAEGAKILRMLRPYGGMRYIYRQFNLMPRDIFPFYLAILIQTSGNPQSLLSASRDCIFPVPLRDDLERVVWEKARAHGEQAPDFSKKKEWSAPNIIRKLVALNENLRNSANPNFSESLFLCRNGRAESVPPSWQCIHLNFAEFKKCHALPTFELRELRKVGGQLHHKAGRSLATAKQRLQHANVTTTQIYTPLSDIRGVHESVVHRFQGLIFSESKKSIEYDVPVSEESIDTSVETLFGFGCRNPFAGIAAGSKSGEICLHFFQCATCPGAMIAVDDTLVVARIFNSYEFLLKERDRSIKEGWSQRFDAVYAPTLQIIEKEILPAISVSVLDEAKKIRCPSLPRLE